AEGHCFGRFPYDLFIPVPRGRQDCRLHALVCALRDRTRRSYSPQIPFVCPHLCTPSRIPPGFLMRESERTTTNGVIWYIIGMNFALTFYPLDVATVSILILSWADTAASTIGRLWAGHWGLYTPRLPSRLSLLLFLPGQLKHCLTLPLAPGNCLRALSLLHAQERVLHWDSGAGWHQYCYA
ncbi:hypothetical protein C8R42DRAFT_746186, partial [Lentinula raphanica]